MPLKIKGLTSGSVVIKAPDTGAEDVEYDIANDFATPTSVTAVDTRVNAVGGRKNLIINGDMQVSQRGDFTSPHSIPSGAQYTVDRWNFYLGSPQVASTFQTQVVTLPNGNTTVSSKLTAAATSNNYFHINQKIEGSNRYNGKTITLSCWVRTDQPNNGIRLCDGSVCVMPGAAIPNDGNWHYMTAQHTLPHNGANIQIQPAFPFSYSPILVGGYIEFAQMQVEIGTVATDFEHRSYGEELALCQRYYEPFGNGWTARGENSNSTVFFGRFKVSKRTDPTIGVLTTNMRMFEWGVADRDASTVSVNINQIHENGGHIKCGGFPSTSTGNLYGLGNNSSTSDGEPFSADAEL